MHATRTRSDRLSLRLSPEARRKIDRAVESTGGSLTRFAEESLTASAEQVLADRTNFLLSPEQARAWDALNARPARDLPGLRRLMDRPSPFDD